MLTFHTFVVYLSTWPRLDAFVCRQWSVIRKWAIGILTQQLNLPHLNHYTILYGCLVCNLIIETNSKQVEREMRVKYSAGRCRFSEKLYSYKAVPIIM